MRLGLNQQSLRRTQRWTQRGLFAVAVSMLAYCGFVLMDTWTFQKGEGRQLERLLTGAQNGKGGAPRRASPTPAKTSALGVTDDLIGRIEIPRLGVTAIVIEGTSTSVLRRAVGHIPGTGLPGQRGNIGISGHRDTFFRPLRNIQQNDIITLTTPLGEYRYRVVSTKVVGPRDVAVLDPSGNEILTLVTCYPFYLVGAAPHRFIVRAERVI
jgi:sortase A